MVSFFQHRRQEVGDGARWRRLPGEVDRTVDQSQRVRGVKAGSRVGDGVARRVTVAALSTIDTPASGTVIGASSSRAGPPGQWCDHPGSR